MRCSSPLVREMQHDSFCLVRPPRTDLAPLVTLISDERKELRRYGPITNVFEQVGELPQPRLTSHVDRYSGRTSGEIEGSLALQFLQHVLNLPLGEGSISRESSTSFELSGVSREDVDQSEIEILLEGVNKTRTEAASNSIKTGRLFIITATMKATKLTMTTDGKAAAGLEAIAGAGALDVRARADGGVDFVAAEPHVFAIQALKLGVRNGSYSVTELARDKRVHLGPDEEARPDYLVLDDDFAFVDEV